MAPITSHESGNLRIFKNWICEQCESKCLCTRAVSEVEVFVLTFQHEHTIGQALDSILVQSLPDSQYSIFVHDDASEDKTVKLALERLAKQSVRWTVVQETTNQFSKSKFRFVFDAVTASRSKYLAFLEGDDYWSSTDKLARQARFLNSAAKANLIHTRYHVRNELSNSISIQPDAGFRTKKLESASYLLRENFIGALTAMIRVSAVQETPLDFSKYTFEVADYPLWLAATSHAGSMIGFDPTLSATYRIHAKNYWAKTNFFDGLQATRKVQRSLGEALGRPIGMSKLRLIASIVGRRIIEIIVKLK